MKRTSVFAAGVVILVMLSAMVLAEQNNSAPAVQEQAGQRESQADKATTSSTPHPGKTGLSRRNKAKIEQAEQRKLRQLEIDKELAADPPSK